MYVYAKTKGGSVANVVLVAICKSACRSFLLHGEARHGFSRIVHRSGALIIIELSPPVASCMIFKWRKVLTIVTHPPFAFCQCSDHAWSTSLSSQRLHTF